MLTRSNALWTLISAVIVLVVAIVVPPYLPAPLSVLLMWIGYLVAFVLFVLGIVALVRGRGV